MSRLTYVVFKNPWILWLSNHLTSTTPVTTVVKVCYFRARKKTQFADYYTGTKLQKQWGSQNQEGPEFILILPPKPWCPSTVSHPKSCDSQWLAVSWATHSSWPVFRKLSFPVWFHLGKLSAGEGSRPRETQVLHKWSKRTVIHNFDFVKHAAELSNA